MTKYVFVTGGVVSSLGKGIAARHGAIPGGDTDCAQANTAMFMAGGLASKDVPHTLAALCRVIGAGRSLVAYECGAVGPGKDCGFENPIIGDTSYGKSRHNRAFADAFGVSRLLLACTGMSFTHPVTGERLALDCPLADDFARVVSALGWDAALPAPLVRPSAA